MVTKQTAKRTMFKRRSRLLFIGISALVSVIVILIGIAAGITVAAEVKNGKTFLTDQEMADSVMTAPPLLTNPPERYKNVHRFFSMNCGMARTPGGRLWSCWISGGDSADAYLVCASSDDDGKTWSEPRLVIDPDELANDVKRRVLIANFWTDPQGKLWLFFDYGLAMFDGRIGLWAVSCANPDADHPSWTPPKRIANGSFHNKPLILAEGTWLIPVELYDRDYTKWDRNNVRRGFQAFPELDDLRGITILASEDQGASWQIRGRCRFPVSAGEEPVCLEKKDGSIWLLARTPKGMFQSISQNRGKTWSKPLPAIHNPVTRFCMLRLNSGNLLLVRHGDIDGSEKGRNRLTAVLSTDDGKTWKNGLLLDERDNVSYPDGFQTSDGKIYITYDRERSRAAEILMAVFTEDDVKAGRPVSSVIRLKQRVTKSGVK